MKFTGFEEQQQVVDISPNFDSMGYFTCGSCGKRCHPFQLHSHHGRGGGKWSQCNDCARRIAKNKRTARKAAL